MLASGAFGASLSEVGFGSTGFIGLIVVVEGGSFLVSLLRHETLITATASIAMDIGTFNLFYLNPQPYSIGNHITGKKK